MKPLLATRALRTGLAFAALVAPTAHALAQDAPAPERFPAAAPADVGLEPGALEALAQTMQGLVDRDEVVGAELLVIKNDRTVLHRAFGWKDREQELAMEPDTIFCVRSMTKAVVGTAVQLALEGHQLKLGDAVAKHLPCFDTDARRGITVEHLLHHTSGLRLSSLMGTELGGVRSLADVAALAAAGEPPFPAGERFSYSDDGTDTLGATIERATGTPLDQFLRERLFQPLGMRDTLTFVAPDEERRARIASNYVGTKGAWTRYWKPGDPSLFPIFLASQGLYCTPRDYARFLSLWKERGRIPGQRLLKMSTVERALAPSVFTSNPTGFRGVEVHWGEMWTVWIDTVGEKRELLGFGHGGSDGTFAYVFPALDLMVLEFTQSRNNHTFAQFESALQEHLLDPLRGRATGKEIAYSAEELDALAGLYGSDDDDEVIALERSKDGVLVEFPGRARLALKTTPTRDRFDFALMANTHIEVERGDDGRALAVIRRHGDKSERYARFEPSAELPSAADVLALRDHSLDRERVRALGALRFEGRFEFTVGAKQGEVTVVCDGPDRLRSTMRGGGIDAEFALDGQQAWTAFGGRAPTVQDAASVERTHFDHVLFAVSDWRERFVELRTLFQRDLEGAPHLLLRGTTRHGNPRYLIVDAATGRLRQELRIEPDMGPAEIGAVVKYGDWRKVGEVEVPMHVEYRYASQVVGTFHARYERVERVAELAPDTFRLTAR